MMSSASHTNKPKNVDEEMYSLLAARELIKKQEMQNKHEISEEYKTEKSVSPQKLSE
jgi:hypothetical protein